MSEIAKCPCCGSAMEETYLGYVCSNTGLEDPCSFRIAKRLLPRISAAMELARVCVDADAAMRANDNDDEMPAIYERFSDAEQRVLEVFK